MSSELGTRLRFGKIIVLSVNSQSSNSQKMTKANIAEPLKAVKRVLTCRPLISTLLRKFGLDVFPEITLNQNIDVFVVESRLSRSSKSSYCEDTDTPREELPPATACPRATPCYMLDHDSKQNFQR